MNWQLWRQDDHGNRFWVGEFASVEAAERTMGELTRYPHKQVYWIEHLSDRKDRFALPDSEK